MELSKKELNLIREWFDAIADLNQNYLEPKDESLYQRILIEINRLHDQAAKE